MNRHLKKLNTDIGKFNISVEGLGTSNDTIALREHTALLKDEIQRTSLRIKDRLSDSKKQLLHPEEHESLQKSIRSYTIDLERFQQIVELCAEKELASRPTDSTPVNGSENAQPQSSELEPLLTSHEQQHDTHVEDEADYNAVIAERKDREIQRLKSDIDELNKMYEEAAPLLEDPDAGMDVNQASERALADLDVVVNINEIEEDKDEPPILADEEPDGSNVCRRITSALKTCCAMVCGVAVVGSIVCAFIAM